MVYFTEKEKELTHGIYHDMADAVAAAVARRETAQPTVYVAAYMHRFGIDFTAHSTHELAERRLAHIARMQCARDEALRERVVSRFGGWPAQDMPTERLAVLIEDWHAVAEGEALWVSECDVQTIARHASDPFEQDQHRRVEIDELVEDRAVTKPYPPPTDIASAGDQAGEFDEILEPDPSHAHIGD